jgi:tRNA threonylcarbamoyl adenosine modification protein YeaZ
VSIVLAIDTATPAVTAGVLSRGPSGVEVLAERVTVDPRAHAEQLTPNVLGALSDAGLGMADLEAVVIGCGPGPFTGLRVGMATAAAYGHALGIPVHGVCSLDAIGVDTTGEILVVTDARRREVYWARYRDGVRIDGPAVNAAADVPAGVSGVAGSPEHAALFGLPLLPPGYPTVSGLVRVVDWAVPEGRSEATGEVGWPEPLIPLYLRRPDAKPQPVRS